MTRGSRWIEETFYKRECCQIVHCTKEKTRCGCGEHVSLHAPVGSPQPVGEARWNPMRHTTRSPTDAYGSIDFQAGAHPSKAKYIRLSYDTRPETVLTLLTQEWQLEAPKLLVSVHGGKQNFLLQPQLKKAFTEGLLRVAKSTGAWILSNGMDTGVTHHVGDVLISERSPCLRPGAGRVVSIGVAPWGVIESRECLISKMKDIPYQAISSPKSKFCVLNKWHSYFLLVDNGTVGKHGAEIPFRKRLERHISRMPLTASTTSIPVVCLVLEGGLNTIRTVFEYVTDTPPVPVVIVDGSGRASDLLAFMLRYETTPLSPLPDAVQEQLLATIQRTFDIAEEQSQLILDELLECVYRKDMITVYELDGKSTLDMALLTTLLKQKCLSVQDQLSLTIVWNRVDIAKDKIFVYGQEWPPGSLSSSMMDALMLDRLDFVKLLLENGVTMDKFLTIPRLEELYNVAVGPTNTLRYLVADVRPTLPSNPRYTLMDIGLVIEKLMGGAFRSNYCRRRFRLVYAAVMNRAERNLFGTLAPVASVLRFANLATKPKPQMGAKGEDLKDRFFDYPFNELMLWAILTKRQQMALLMWSHGEEAVVKAIVASKLYRAMAHEAKDDDLEAEVYEELKQCAREFEVRALELLDYCYRQDDELAQQLLTYELANWSRMTSLSLAVTANHRALLAHPCAQILLADLWLGGLRMRKSTNLKVLLGIFCPPAILILMDFKTEEELHWQPQTEEEVESSELPSCETSDGTRHRRPSTSSSSTDDSLPGRRSLASASSGFTFSRATSQQPSNGLLMDPEAGNDGRHLLHASFRRRKHRRSSGSSGRSRERDHPKVTFSLPRNSGPPQTPSPQQLTNRKKIYEFYNAPITKFWIHSIAYVVFLCFFTHLVLVKMDPLIPTWQEIYVTVFLFSFKCDKIRELLSSEPTKMSQKLAVWFENRWNICDFIGVSCFFLGTCFRFTPQYFRVGRVIYCVDIIYWYVRLLDILSVNKYLGPFVTMIGKMVVNMAYFVILLAVVLLSFGVARQSILNPDHEFEFSLVKAVLYQPYFMLYGEVFADDIDPSCGGPDEVLCHTGRWITPAIMSIYLLVANILLINLLIAVFNNIFNEVNQVSHQVWMFQRFTVVMEYEQKPILPPPLMVLNHIYLLLRMLRRHISGKKKTFSHGLKLFLSGDQLERIHDFEEECMEGYFREKEKQARGAPEERIRMTTDRTEQILARLSDLTAKEKSDSTSLRSLEIRLGHLERLLQDVLARNITGFYNSQGAQADPSSYYSPPIAPQRPPGVHAAPSFATSGADKDDDMPASFVYCQNVLPSDSLTDVASKQERKHRPRLKIPSRPFSRRRFTSEPLFVHRELSVPGVSVSTVNLTTARAKGDGSEVDARPSEVPEEEHPMPEERGDVRWYLGSEDKEDIEEADQEKEAPLHSVSVEARVCSSESLPQTAADASPGAGAAPIPSVPSDSVVPEMVSKIPSAMALRKKRRRNRKTSLPSECPKGAKNHRLSGQWKQRLPSTSSQCSSPNPLEGPWREHAAFLPQPVFVPRVSEYTSITDEIETVVRQLQQPSSDREERPPLFPAVEMEKQILREAEDTAYHLMEPLVTRRLGRVWSNSEQGAESVGGTEGEATGADLAGLDIEESDSSSSGEGGVSIATQSSAGSEGRRRLVRQAQIDLGGGSPRMGTEMAVLGEAVKPKGTDPEGDG